jgi:hypothetical protein
VRSAPKYDVVAQATLLNVWLSAGPLPPAGHLRVAELFPEAQKPEARASPSITLHAGSSSADSLEEGEGFRESLCGRSGSTVETLPACSTLSAVELCGRPCWPQQERGHRLVQTGIAGGVTSAILHLHERKAFPFALAMIARLLNKKLFAKIGPLL